MRPGGPAGRIERLSEILLAALLCAGGLLFLAVAVRMVASPQEAVISEGAVRVAAERLARGHSLYDPARLREAPFVTVQYPPLFYLVTAGLVRLFGEGYWAGRLVSSLASLATALVIGLVVRRKSGSAAAAGASGLAYLCFYHVVMWGTTHRVDSLGVFFCVAGLALYERARERGSAVVPAAALFVAGLLVKQVLAAAAAAAVLDLALARQWRRAAAMAGTVLGTTVALYGLLTLHSRGGFWTMTVIGTISPEADPPWTIFMNATTFFDSAFPLTALAVCLFLLASGGRPGPWGLMLLFGLPWAIATDANIPRFMEPLAAMAVVVGCGLAALRRGEPGGRPAYRLAIVSLALSLGATFLYEQRTTIVRERLLNPGPGNSREEFAKTLERLTSPQAAVLAQDLDIVLGAGRPVYLNDPVVFSILRGNGAWEPVDLIQGARDRRFEAIVLNRPVEALDPDEWITLWIAPVAEAIARNYVLAERLVSRESYRFYEPERYFYVPRAESPPEPGL